MPPVRMLMIQGTISDAGKSTLVTALCRVLARRGVSVAPFKPQNMALNSAVTVDGGEIGRSQAVQAQACYLEPHTDMNPVLLKPNSDVGAQVIIQGKALTNMEAGEYHDYKSIAKAAVLESHGRLGESYDVIMVEGAGSPAEINLRDRDIANMGFAEAVDCPVILVADIDRGGVFAHLVGTLQLLSASEQARIKGFVINRFRGDIELLKPGLNWLARYTGKRCSASWRTCKTFTSRPRTRSRPSSSPGVGACCISPCPCCRASATTPISIRCDCTRKLTCSSSGRGNYSRVRPDHSAREQERPSGSALAA